MTDMFSGSQSNVYKTNIDQTDKERKFYNTYAWRVMSQKVKDEAFGQCEVCYEEDGVENKATYTHHVIPLRDSWDKRLDKDNLIAVCGSHHERFHNRSGSGKPSYMGAKQLLKEQIKKNGAPNIGEAFDNL